MAIDYKGGFKFRSFLRPFLRIYHQVAFVLLKRVNADNTVIHAAKAYNPT